MTRYTVQKGDSLWKIARVQLGDPIRWPEIARLNRMDPAELLLIGRVLDLPERSAGSTRASIGGGGRPSVLVRAEVGRDESADAHKPATVVPGRAFLFVLSDEVLPSAKVVRKVLTMPITAADHVAANPELFGLRPTGPGAAVSLGEHALGETPSPFTSASTKPAGAPNIAGRPVYIDVAKAEAAGAKLHTTAEIAADLDRLVGLNPALGARVAKLKEVIEKVEGEVLIEGEVPAAAVKSGKAMAVTRGLRFVQAVGVVVTAYDLGRAGVASVETESIRPIAAESVRQLGGWGGAWIGFKIGAAAGAAVGIETGPGAIATSAIGGVIFGAAGYLGFDILASSIDGRP